MKYVQKIADIKEIPLNDVIEVVKTSVCSVLQKTRKMEIIAKFIKNGDMKIYNKDNLIQKNITRAEAEKVRCDITSELDKAHFAKIKLKFAKYINTTVSVTFKLHKREHFIFDLSGHEVYLKYENIIPNERFFPNNLYTVFITDIFYIKNTIGLLGDRFSSNLVFSLIKQNAETLNINFQISKIYRIAGFKTIIITKNKLTYQEVIQLLGIGKAIESNVTNIDSALRGEKTEIIYIEEKIESFLERILNNKTKIILSKDNSSLICFNKKFVRAVLGKNNLNLKILNDAFQANITKVIPLDEEKCPFLYFLNTVFSDFSSLIFAYKTCNFENEESLLKTDIKIITDIDKIKCHEMLISLIGYYTNKYDDIVIENHEHQTIQELLNEIKNKI